MLNPFFKNTGPHSIEKLLNKIDIQNKKNFKKDKIYDVKDLSSASKRDLTFFIPIEKDTKDLYIKKGDPLFLLTPLCENKIKINYKIIDHLKPNLTFSTLKKYLMDKLI